MRFEVALGAAVVGLFIGMLICLNVGFRFGRRRLEKDPESTTGGTGTLDAAIFGLMGLILAFSFGGAATRFDARRHFAVEEANAIGTAYLRIDLLPAETQPAMRDRFRLYLDTRLDAYSHLPDVKAALAELARSEEMQREIWTEAERASRAGNYMPAPMQLLPALNAMIDITTTRTAATRIHPPKVIFGLLFALALLSSLLAGYGMAGNTSRRWLYMIVFSAVISLTVYVIIDLEYPRLGLIRVDAADKVLVDLRASMNEVNEQPAD
jgi:cytochrome c oxidase subunit IV